MKNIFKFIFASTVILFFNTMNIFSQDILFSGSSKTELGIYIRGDDAGCFSLAKETVASDLNIRFANCETLISANIFFDALAANQSEKFSFMDGLGGELKEAYFSWTSGEFGKALNFSLKVGRQISAWGKADGIKITDVLCPQNLTTLNTGSYSESRLGIDAIKLSLSGMIFSVDLYYLPFFRPSALPLDSWNKLGKTLLPESVEITGLPNPIPIERGKIEKPTLSLLNATYASRISFWLSRIDFSFYGFYGFDDFLILSYSLNAFPPSKITVSGKYYQYGMAGFDFAVPVKSLVFRFESAMFINRAFQTNSSHILQGGECFEKKQELRALFGLDWMQDGWTLTAQYYGDAIFGSVDSLSRKNYEHGTTFSLSKSLLSETLTLGINAAINWNDFDSYASAYIDYAL
ncbi:MAG: hypothetical protein IJR49_02010, partial [Treponema sp.]|nr:hypothetical protein [Treponema sp.]